MKKKKTRVLQNEEQEKLQEIIRKAKEVNETGEDSEEKPKDEEGIEANLFADLFLYNGMCMN